MSENLQLKDYKIPKINMDFEKLSTGEQKIGIDTSFSIMIPKNPADNTCIIVIKTNLLNSENESVLSVTIRGQADVCEPDLDAGQKKTLLENQICPILYNHLREFIAQLLEKAKIDFMNIPAYEELNG